MTFNAKTAAWVGIPLLAAASIATLNTTSQGVLWESGRTTAAAQEAIASNRKVDVEAIDTANRLKAAETTALAAITAAQTEAAAIRATAAAMIEAAQRNAGATIAAAQKQAEGLVASTEINAHPENEMYDSFTGLLIGEPSKKIAKLNEEIIRLKRNSQYLIGESAKAEAMARVRHLEEEKAIVEETSAKNIGDAFNLVLKGMGGSFGGFGGLYPNGNEPPPERRIIQER